MRERLWLFSMIVVGLCWAGLAWLFGWGPLVPTDPDDR